MPITTSKQQELENRMKELGLFEEDLVEKFILGTGSGGQKLNKTASCVYLKHLPSGIEIKCQKERSRAMNRFFARRMLIDKFEEITLGALSKKQQTIEKIRRQKRKKSKRAKEKMLEEKSRVAQKKEYRKPVNPLNEKL